MLLNRPAKYQAEYDLWVNERNPYYEYVSQASSATLLQLKGVYSKEDNFTITNTGYAQFYFNSDDSPTGIGLQYNNPQPTNLWTYNKEVLEVCTNDYSTKSLVASSGEQSPNENTLLLIPNPASNNVTCHFTFNENKESETEVTVFNSKGEILYRVKTLKTEINLPITNLQSGLYFVKVNNQAGQMVEKLIIQ